MVRSRRAKGFAQKRAYGNAGKQRALCSLTRQATFFRTTTHQVEAFRFTEFRSSKPPRHGTHRRVYTLHLEHPQSTVVVVQLHLQNKAESLSAIANACSLTLAVWSKTAWHKKMGKLMCLRELAAKRESAVLGHFVSDVAVCGTFDAGQERQKEQHDAFTRCLLLHVDMGI